MSSVVTQLCTVPYLQEDNNGIIVGYTISLGFVSVFFIIFGYQFLFERPASPDNDIGSHDKGMGLVVAFISVLLVGLEIVLIVMVFMRENSSVPFAIYLVVFTVEKVVQVMFYIGMRRRVPRPEFRRGTVFYFHFLSFLNFTLWLNSIPFTNIQIYDEVSHSDVLKYADQTFKALLIDYRLLCALLFLEHALEIGDEDGHNHVRNDVDKDFEMPVRRYLYMAVGLGVGLVFLGLEIVNAVQFWCDSIPDIVNLFPILIDVCLVVSGCLLLRNVKISVLHDEKVSFVLLMVTCMGAVSIIYLLSFSLLSLISFTQDEPASYVKWSACVFISRGLSLLVLLLVYTGVPVRTMESRNNFNTANYILVSVLWFGLFAKFLGNVLDEFNGTMHHIAHKHLESNHLRTLQDLFVIGPLFQLATTLHLALHFLVMLLRLCQQPVVEAENVEDGQGNEEAQPGQGNLVPGQEQAGPQPGQGSTEVEQGQENKEAKQEDGESEEARRDRMPGRPLATVGSYGAMSANKGTEGDSFFKPSDVEPTECDERTKLLQPIQRC